MRHPILTTTTLLILAAALAAPAAAQMGNSSGGLPQEVQRSMRDSMTRLESRDALRSLDTLEEQFGKAAIDAFLAGAVVRLVLEPTGAYRVSWQRGGEVVGIQLGKKSLELPGRSSVEEPWIVKSGEFQAAKKPQPLSLKLRAGTHELAVDCFNEYRKGKETVTYFVGPLDGLFCLGLTDEALGDQPG